MATTREDACEVEWWFVEPFSVYFSLGVELSVFPGGYKRLVDCELAAHDCQEVKACAAAYYRVDHDNYHDELEQLPKCGSGSERTDHCEGNVAKYCLGDHNTPETFYQASYDCTLAGATCVEWQSESGDRWADCQTPQLQCEGPDTSYCDGTRAVVCETHGDVLSPWVYDCADAFGSHCFDRGENVTCEGPVTGEKNCDDGKDGDGKVDCDDEDCEGYADCP